jgi:hypothetical protein
MRRPLWFKAKRYGYGWYPASWQGWLVMAAWLLVFATASFRWNVETEPMWYVADVALSTVILLVVTVLTGEKARWRWGGE